AKTAGNGSRVFQADLADEHSCDRLFHEVITRFGCIDVLINNAGVFIKSPLSGKKWLSDWNRTMAINLNAAAMLTRHAVNHFIARGGGTIIYLASRAAFRGDGPDYLAYAASKAALVALSRSIARAYGKHGIVSFVVAPGWVSTGMSAHAIRTRRSEILAEQALGRITKPRDIAPLVTLLASGMADHATGAAIDVNAGSYVH
ncbi:MAG: SDR family oxidoreductase, partial [Chitinispirillaceae bacterium]|nr:SDR family oxidoreductase [Chitinispirillaceae bacterium]